MRANSYGPVLSHLVAHSNPLNPYNNPMSYAISVSSFWQKSTLNIEKLVTYFNIIQPEFH